MTEKYQVMINFSDKPNKGNPGDISKRGLGFRQETMRAGLFLHREKPGENGCIVRQEFSYYYDREGEELIDESDYTFDNIYENCGSIHWKLIQTDIPNIEKFESSEKGWLVTNLIYEDTPIDITLEKLQKNLQMKHKECKINFEFNYLDNKLNDKTIFHRVLNSNGQLMKSFREFKVHTEYLEINWKGNILRFKIWYEHRISEKNDKLKFNEFKRQIKGNIEYKIKHKPYESPLLSILGPRDIILSCKDGGQWWSGWKFKEYRGLDIFLEPLQDMSKYFSNVKTNGYSNKKLNTEIELGMIDMLKSSDDFLSPYFDESQKQEDALADQFVAVVQNQKEGKEVRLSYSQLGIKPEDMMERKNWELRETPEFYEGDIRLLSNANVWWELQEKESDQVHLNGLFGRISVHSIEKNDYDFYIWTADKHTKYRRLIRLLKTLNWREDNRLKKILLITNEQLLNGFENHEIISIDVESEIINKS